jgi:hypothetical protein
MCPICCPARIKTTFDFVPNILQYKGWSVFEITVSIDLSSYSRLQALAERKPHLSQSLLAEIRGGQIGRSRRSGSGPPSAYQLLRQPPVQECCHLAVDVRWHSVRLKNNIWFVLKCLGYYPQLQRGTVGSSPS